MNDQSDLPAIVKDKIKNLEEFQKICSYIKENMQVEVEYKNPLNYVEFPYDIEELRQWAALMLYLNGKLEMGVYETQCLHEYLRNAGVSNYNRAYKQACTYEEKINRHWRKIYYLDSCNNMQPLPPYKPISADGRELFIHEELLATMDVEEIVNLILKLYKEEKDAKED